MDGFEDRFGYSPDLNELVPGTGRSGSVLRSVVAREVEIPRSVIEFFDAIEEVSLPDVWNGYFLGPVDWVASKHAAREPRWMSVSGDLVEILLVGSDGGGALYAVALSDGAVYRLEEPAIADGVARTAVEHQISRLADDFSDFLDLFAAGLESLASDGSTPSF